MPLSEAAALAGGRLHGEDRPFRGLSTDSRTLVPENLFVALRGPRFDGHDFAAGALAAGAAGVLVDRDLEPGPRIRVDDTRAALGALAAAWRERFSLPVVAVTGSNGKTTVKTLLAAVLATQGPALATEGNLNNEIGVPLMLARLGPEHRAAVFELGANHPGEIARLAGWVRPTVGVITNAGPAHLAGFGSIEGVARAKGELIAALPPEGTVVLNTEDPHVGLWRRLAGARPQLGFGLAVPAEVRAEWAPEGPGSRVLLQTPAGDRELRLAFPGRHNVMNALAAAAAALALGVPLDRIAAGLEAARPVPGRLCPCPGPAGSRILDDTYNANPASVRAALEVLVAQPGEHWLVLGDMGELGAQAAALHARIGQEARSRGVHRLFTTGPLAARAAEAFGSGAAHFDAPSLLAAALRDALREDVTVLVKGSRAARMEQVVQALCEDAGGGC
ncbi:MAG: UDP-N-acetylmuramoyl-tripeptide--D-alanyl-D-alanine ligase [Gammaproteobacteria bacterium]|nr:MAG: UDP-N-acetylmuramoyl-tripeptide--D-alanyl-D-alanine ligase [Gammaproteobacteria bacterium]